MIIINRPRLPKPTSRRNFKLSNRLYLIRHGGDLEQPDFLLTLTTPRLSAALLWAEPYQILTKHIHGIGLFLSRRYSGLKFTLSRYSRPETRAFLPVFSRNNAHLVPRASSMMERRLFRPRRALSKPAPPVWG